MTSVKRNLAANFVGNAWTSLLTLGLVPAYIHFLGIEAYGLIGIFVTLTGLLALLDLGLGNTVNRETARLAVREGTAQEMRDLVRTLEIPYWAVGVMIASIVVAASPLLAYRWVRPENLAPTTVLTAFVIMGLSIAVQWPLSFYSGALLGLQRQVLLNSINVAMATARGLGALAIIWLLSPTLEAFFVWQGVIGAAHTAVAAALLWRSLPAGSRRARFHLEILKRVWRFAAGVTGIALVSTILTQADKVILSRMLSLENFGYYVLAGTAAMSLLKLTGPVYHAIYPRFTNLVELGAIGELASLYHRSAQLLSVLVLPAAAVLALNSRELLLVWTQSATTAANTHVLVSILVAGTALNAIMHTPYALQLASGWTRLALMANSIAVVLLIPLMIILTLRFGAVGAASVWVVLNTGYVIISIQVMHRRLLVGHMRRWYLQDVGAPLTAAVLVAGAARLLLPVPNGSVPAVAFLFSVGLAALAGSAAVTTVTRRALADVFARGKGAP